MKSWRPDQNHPYVRALLPYPEFGWPNGQLPTPSACAKLTRANGSLAMNLARSGIRWEVPAAVSLLETLEKAGKASPTHALKASACGCSLPVRRAAPPHRNLNLTDQQKAANTT
jgi:hypothetical protein